MEDVWGIIWKTYFSKHVLPTIPKVGDWNKLTLFACWERDMLRALFDAADDIMAWDILRSMLPMHYSLWSPDTPRIFYEIVARANVTESHAEFLFEQLLLISQRGWFSYYNGKCRQQMVVFRRQREGAQLLCCIVLTLFIFMNVCKCIDKACTGTCTC